MGVYKVTTESGAVYQVTTEDPKLPLTAGETFTGGMSDILGKLTFGAGDEIIAGGSSVIDALTGGPGYDARLGQVRDLQERYGAENPKSAMLNNLAALWAPMPKAQSTKFVGPIKAPTSIWGRAKTAVSETLGATDAAGMGNAIKNAGKGATLGAGYGAAGGFLEGEGDSRMSGAVRGAAAGGAFGAAASTIGEGLSGVANKAGEWAKGLARKSLGARYSDYAKNPQSVAQLDEFGNAKEVMTKTRASMDDLLESGKLGESRDPQDLVRVTQSKMDELEEQIGREVSAYDEAHRGWGGAKVFPDWRNTIEWLAKGGGGEKLEAFWKRLTDLDEIIRREGNGALSYLQKQKVQKGKSWDAKDTINNEFDRMLYSDMQRAIEDAIPDVKPLNRELGKYLTINSMVQRGLINSEKRNIGETLIDFTKTTGGFGTPILAAAYTGGAPLALATVPAAMVAKYYLTNPQGQAKLAGALPKLGEKIAAGQGKIAKELPGAKAGLSGLFGISQGEKANQKGEAERLVRELRTPGRGQESPQSDRQSQSEGTPSKSKKESSLWNPSKQLSALLSASPAYADTLDSAPASVSKQQKSDLDVAFEQLGGGMDAVKAPIAIIEQQIDADPYYSALYEAESGRNPEAKNPKSTAAGGFQFIKATAKALGVDPMDLGKSFEAVKKLTAQHDARFGDDPINRYSAHYLGAPLFAKVINDKPLTEKEKALVESLYNQALPRFLKIYRRIAEPAKQGGEALKV